MGDVSAKISLFILIFSFLELIEGFILIRIIAYIKRACHPCNARIVFNLFFLLFSDFNLQKNNKNNVLNNNQHFSKLLNKLDHDKLFACNIYCFPNLNLV